MSSLPNTPIREKRTFFGRERIPSPPPKTSFPPLSCNFYQTAILLESRFKIAKERLFEISLLGKDEEEKFLKKKIEKRDIEDICEDREMIDQLVRKMCCEVKSVSEKHLKHLKKNFSKKKNCNFVSSETYMVLMNYQIKKLLQIVEDMNKISKKLGSFIRRLKVFSTQSYVVTQDFNYTMKSLYLCIRDLEFDIKGMEKFLMKRKEGCVISQVFSPKNKSQESSKKMRRRRRMSENLSLSTISIGEQVQHHRRIKKKKFYYLRLVHSKPIFLKKSRNSYNFVKTRRSNDERLKGVINTPNRQKSALLRLKKKRNSICCIRGLDRKNECNMKSLFRKSEDKLRRNKLVFHKNKSHKKSLPRISRKTRSFSTKKRVLRKNQINKRKNRRKSTGMFGREKLTISGFSNFKFPGSPVTETKNNNFIEKKKSNCVDLPQVVVEDFIPLSL